MYKDYKNTPLWNSGLSEEERLQYLLRELTLDEKFACLGTGNPAIERLGIPAFGVGGEGAHGVQARHDQSYDKGEPVATTIFPNPIGMSASWDRELIKEAGTVVGTEARALYEEGLHGSLSLWAPTVDMERDPRWGRTEEGYGEDPYLTAEMAGAYVEGMQGDHPHYLRCGATLKHYYANNVEQGRTYISSSVDLRNKHEYYLEPFRKVITEHHVEGMMTAYNEINGIPCMLLDNDIKLAKSWGLGHVVSDGGDVNQTVHFHKYFKRHSETVAAGLKAGMDCFTDDMEMIESAAREAYEHHMIQMEDIDKALYRYFRVMLRLGFFDRGGRNPYEQVTMEEVGTAQSQKVARDITAESVVMVKNDGILPLGAQKAAEDHCNLLSQDSGDNVSSSLQSYDVSQRLHTERENVKSKLAVIGPLSDVWYKDWYSGVPPYFVTPLDGVKNALQPESLNSRISGKQSVTEGKRNSQSSELQGATDESLNSRLQELQGAADESLNSRLQELQGVTDESRNSRLQELQGAADESLNSRIYELHSAVSGNATVRIKVSTGVEENAYLGLQSDGKSIGLVSKEAAESFILTDWGDGKVTLRAKSNGLLLTTQDDESIGEKGDILAAKEEAFGWFVKEIFYIEKKQDSYANTFAASIQKSDAFAENENVEQPDAFAENENVEQPDTFAEYENAKQPVAFTLKTWDQQGISIDEKGALRKDRNAIGLPVKMEVVEDGIAQAAIAAKEADTVLLFLGANPMITCKEEIDRTHIMLPYTQQKLLEEVCKVNSNVILVLISSVPYDLRMAQDCENVRAILLCAEGSMELGNAVMDVITGKKSVAGRLPMTWYGSLDGFPDINDYDIIQKGRTYQYYEGEALYPFGYGLTYSEMEYSGLTVQLKDYTKLLVQAEVSNIGKYRSDEVVQLYIRKKDSTVKRPFCQLKGFERLKDLKPGEKRNVSFAVLLEELKYYDVIAKEKLLEPGEYEILLGRSSKDIRQSQSIVLNGTKRPCRDGFATNESECFDRALHYVLCSGHLGYTSVCTKNESDTIILDYEKVYLSHKAKGIVLDFWKEHTCDVEIFIDGKKVGKTHISAPEKEEEKQLEAGEANGDGAFDFHQNWITQRREIGFCEIEIPLCDVPVDKEFTLTVSWKGRGKICTWRFVND